MDLIPVAGKVFKLVKVGYKAGRILTKETVKKIVKSEVREYISDASITFVIDVASQFVVNYCEALLDSSLNASLTVDPIIDAVSKIDFVDKAVLSLNSAGNYFENVRKNYALTEIFTCAEKSCQAFKNEQAKIKEGKKANGIQDAVVKCLFDVFINLDPTILAERMPNNKLKKIVFNWGKIQNILKKKYPTLYQSVIISLGNSFEIIYDHVIYK